jgi:hypothetical protein
MISIGQSQLLAETPSSNHQPSPDWAPRPNRPGSNWAAYSSGLQCQ